MNFVFQICITLQNVCKPNKFSIARFHHFLVVVYILLSWWYTLRSFYSTRDRYLLEVNDSEMLSGFCVVVVLVQLSHQTLLLDTHRCCVMICFDKWAVLGSVSVAYKALRSWCTGFSDFSQSGSATRSDPDDSMEFLVVSSS